MFRNKGDGVKKVQNTFTRIPNGNSREKRRLDIRDNCYFSKINERLHKFKSKESVEELEDWNWCIYIINTMHKIGN